MQRAAEAGEAQGRPRRVARMVLDRYPATPVQPGQASVTLVAATACGRPGGPQARH